jgi:hypothetical protein
MEYNEMGVGQGYFTLVIHTLARCLRAAYSSHHRLAPWGV